MFRNFYADADIYVSPSFHEFFGVSLIEAMAAGLPVVRPLDSFPEK